MASDTSSIALSQAGRKIGVYWNLGNNLSLDAPKAEAMPSAIGLWSLRTEMQGKGKDGFGHDQAWLVLSPVGARELYEIVVLWCWNIYISLGLWSTFPGM